MGCCSTLLATCEYPVYTEGGEIVTVGVRLARGFRNQPEFARIMETNGLSLITQIQNSIHPLEMQASSLFASTSDIAVTLNAYKHGQTELLVSPGFFFGLQRRVPSITHVEIKPKLMWVRNEFSRYRYSVILHVHDKPNIISPNESFDLGADGSMDDIRDLLLRTNN